MRIIFSFILFIICSNCFAILCPKNFNVINVGDSMQQVITSCGAPSAQKAYVKKASVPQEWTYFVRFTSADAGSVKMTVAFEEERVTNLTLNGISTATTDVCGAAIKMKDTSETVTKICGKPALITHSQTADAAAETGTKVNELLYKTDTGSVKIVIEDGQLTEVTKE